MCKEIKEAMNVAVIGAGMGGLCAAKNALANGFRVTVFEQTNDIGGTWIYTNSTGYDDNGLKIHTSMYHGLRTNFPKEIMGFSDFPISELHESYISSEDVLKFLRIYAKHFHLLEHIKFQHQVIRVLPKREKKWEVTVDDLVQDLAVVSVFDAVMVCNGHYSEPIIPKYPGQKMFQGDQIHSHDYRRAERFKEEDVLIIGAGVSGLEIAQIIAETAKSITVSTNTPNKDYSTQLPEMVKIRPEVKEFHENQIEFTDGIKENFTAVLYCTGYENSFPFLSMECGVKVIDNYVHPLYKHCINIERPTMIIVGLPIRVSPALIMDMQIRFFMEFLNGHIQLPSREEMLLDTNERMTAKWAAGHKKRHSHIFFGDEQKNYFDELAEEACIEKIKPVFIQLYNENQKNRLADHVNYRNHAFKIIDDDTFIRIK